MKSIIFSGVPLGGGSIRIKYKVETTLYVWRYQYLTRIPREALALITRLPQACLPNGAEVGPAGLDSDRGRQWGVYTESWVHTARTVVHDRHAMCCTHLKFRYTYSIFIYNLHVCTVVQYKYMTAQEKKEMKKKNKG